MIFHTTTLPNSPLRSDAHIWLHSWVAEPSFKTQETGGDWTVLFTQLLATTVPSITILQYIFRDKEIARCVCGSLIYVHFCDLSSSVLQYFKLTKVIKKWLPLLMKYNSNLPLKWTLRNWKKIEFETIQRLSRSNILHIRLGLHFSQLFRVVYGVLFQSDELQLIFCNWCTIISLDDSWGNYSIYMFSRNESNCLREKLCKREVVTSNFASGNQEVISIITQKYH